jgi:hypothetical protein
VSGSRLGLPPCVCRRVRGEPCGDEDEPWMGEEERKRGERPRRSEDSNDSSERRTLGGVLPPRRLLGLKDASSLTDVHQMT